MALDYASLKKRQREERDAYPVNLSLRVHRALSWLDRAERCDDDDGRFIFLWIAFNAAYANEIGDRDRDPEQKVFGRFLRKLTELDKSDALYELIWTEFPSSIRLLLDNQFVFQPFWDYHNRLIEEQTWKREFEQAKVAANKALAGHSTTTVLAIILSRMYTLRNQLVHGGATWNSSVNRDQLRDCSAFLGKLVPFIIQLMMDNPDTLWGDACYPVVD
ncbi:HEPN domain-containing protein [Pseudohalioglobus lutimaris]|uniref:HEPN domain-containing protein n=1 Tax=Pseudohalioglobus lutimaris TaxID=1737061 RepID=UPI001E5B32BE|nr:HEPN domain-containing protein [Pseudohalioglobus lutimaris]